MIDHADPFRTARRPDLYLTRLLGPKLAVLVVLLVLYLSIRHQLITHLYAGIMDLGLAHAEAWLRLTLGGDPNAIVPISIGGKTHDLFRHTIAHADLFLECWRAVLWQIERGVIAAILFIAAPPIIWFIGCTAWELWCESRPQPVPLSPTGIVLPADDISLREVPPPPLNRFEPEPVDEVPAEAECGAPSNMEAPPADAPVLPTAVPRKRKPKAKLPPDVDPPDAPPTPPLVQPGQVRRRPRKGE